MRVEEGVCFLWCIVADVLGLCCSCNFPVVCPSCLNPLLLCRVCLPTTTAAAAGVGLDPGSLPSLAELQSLLGDSLAAGPSGRAAVHSVGQQDSNVSAAEGDVWAGRADSRARLLAQVVLEPDAVPHAATVNQLMNLLAGGSGNGSHSAASTPAAAAEAAVAAAAGGPLDPTAVLTGYLQSGDGARATDPRLAFLSDAVGQLEGPAAVGASFPALLGPLLQLGLLSTRQVHSVTQAVEAARWGGRLPLTGASSTTAKAALSAVELSDFHRCESGGDRGALQTGTDRCGCMCIWWEASVLYAPPAFCRVSTQLWLLCAACHLVRQTRCRQRQQQPSQPALCLACVDCAGPLPPTSLRRVMQQAAASLPVVPVLTSLLRLPAAAMRRRLMVWHSGVSLTGPRGCPGAAAGGGGALSQVRGLWFRGTGACLCGLLV
jgi:hypothetical protein